MLFIDSSARLANVFVIEDGHLLSEGFDSGEKTHASMLLPVIDKAMKDAGLTVNDIDVFGVANGPGSYTGLRIAVACAKMLAYGSNKPLVTVNTLDFIALSALHAAGEYKKSGSYILTMLDARNTLCFYAVYKIRPGDSLEDLTGVQSDYTADILDKLGNIASPGNTVILCGDGSIKNKEAIDRSLKDAYFPEIKEITGNYKGACAAVCKQLEKSSDRNDFLPGKAAADYYKEVHITLRSAGNGN